MAITKKFDVKQGEALQIVLFVKDINTGDVIDLLGFTAKLQIRQNEQDIVRDFLETDDVTTSNGRIILDDGIAQASNVALSWTSQQATDMNLHDGRGVQQFYSGVGDLELKNSEGEVVISIRLLFSQTRETTLV